MDPLVRAIRRNATAVADVHSGVHATACRLADAARVTASDAASAACAVAFWLGIVLPFLHVPLLLVGGLTETTKRPLIALWALHALVLVVGSRHDPGVGRANRE